ncbi:MAG: DUF4179 domain-containing protein [Candidatus Choladocola sp.]|nr:DUF4179 domain-containing protein [Candidatus Choladocola sp.]
MSRFDDMINGLRQGAEVPDHVWEKYTYTLSNLPDRQSERKPHLLSRRRMWPVAAAAVLVIGTISVSAAAYIHWSRGLEERLRITAEQRQELEKNQMASYVGQSVTQGEVTVTAQESIVDNYFAHLSFKVEGYQAEAGRQPGFSGIAVTVGEDEDYTGGWSASFYDGIVPGPDGKAIHTDGTPLAEGEEISYVMEDGSMEFHVDMMSDEKGAFFDKPIHVELKDLGVYSGKAEDVAVEAEGDWSFDWILTGSEDVKKLELNAPLEGSEAVILEAELSPISVSVTYDFPRQSETEMGTDENGEATVCTTYKEPPYFTGVRLKDGTIYTCISGGGISGYETEDTDIYKSITALERVIDVDQIESLLFIRSRPEGEQPLTEENLYFVSVEDVTSDWKN